MKASNILGVSAYYHDSAAALLKDGELVAAAQQERFSRKKHDAAFPVGAIRYCLEAENLRLKELDRIVFYDKPLIKFERLLETYLSYAPHGFRSFVAAMPVWLKEKLYLKSVLKKELSQLGDCKPKELPPLLFAEHHESHAGSAFFFSPFERAAVLCLDGVGEWATTSTWLGNGSAFTYFTGFRVNSGEYKLMGLAPYGQPKYAELILDKLLDLKADGTFRLDMQYFNYCTGLTMTNSRFDEVFGGPPRKPESELTQREMDRHGRSGATACQNASQRNGREEPLSRRGRGAQLRRKRPAAARGAVRKYLDSAGRRRCGRCCRSRRCCLARLRQTAASAERQQQPCRRPDARVIPRAPIHGRANSGRARRSGREVRSP
jgi:predicted NodU family carbamoyl transferase